MIVLISRFEPFVLRLYCSSAFQAVILSISLELFDSLDYFVSSLQSICTYEPFLEILWHLPPQLVVEIIFFYWCQERVLEALQVPVEVDYQLSLQILFGLLVAVISLCYVCFSRSESVIYNINEYLSCDVF
jgi:hypothetical protein